jgi:hypothetical protein
LYFLRKFDILYHYCPTKTKIFTRKQIALINFCLYPKGRIDFQQFTSFRNEANKLVKINQGKV